MGGREEAAEEPECDCGTSDSAVSSPCTDGLPAGYCGWCAICGRPGHTRHFPGPVPVTGAWCDLHYRMLRWLHPQGQYGRHVWILLVVAAAVAYVIASIRHR